MSFLLDPPLLVATGAAIERLAATPRTADRLGRLTVGAYYGVSVPLWLDADAKPLTLFWRPFGSDGGRDFMVNSGVLDLPVPRRARAWHHLAAAAVFATYPLFLRAGRALARRWAGSTSSATAPRNRSVSAPVQPAGGTMAAQASATSVP